MLVEHSHLQLQSMSSRRVKADLEDSLFGATLATKDTIRYALSLNRPPSEGDHGGVVVLVSLGDGVCGHSHIVHGGFTAMLVDEACGLANMIYNEEHTFTAYLNVNYKKPIPTPSVVLCRAAITKVQGRKRFVKCSVEGPSGLIYAESDSLFLQFKEGYKL